MKDPVLWQAIIAAVFGGIVSILTWWTRRSTKAIEHSVNSHYDKMEAKNEALEMKVATLELTIREFMVSRAATATLAPVTMAALQSPHPLKTAEAQIEDTKP